MVTIARESVDDLQMDRALALANRGRGRTSPNPMVGAVIVSRDGRVVGTGFHERAGEPHAEMRAINDAGPGIEGATMYCTLEPCVHEGRTGPCVARIVEAGISRVVVAVRDPNPRVNGTGIAYLRAHGVEVDVGVRRVAAARLNEAFFTWATHGRPFVTMKIATSLDGRIAARHETRTRLTGEASAEMLHRTRAEVDAIAIGSTTLRVDDPLLTVRGVARRLPLTRVVLDRRLQTPPTARLLRTLDAGPVVIVTTQTALAERPGQAAELRAAGATLEPLSTGSMTDVMTRLAELEITSVLLEGGTQVHRAAWAAAVVDRVQRYVAPVVLGHEGVRWLDDEVSIATLKDVRVSQHGMDVLMEGYVHRVD